MKNPFLFAAPMFAMLLLAAGAPAQAQSHHDAQADIRARLDNDRRLEAEYRKKGDEKNAERMHRLAVEHERELGMSPDKGGAPHPDHAAESPAAVRGDLQNDRRLEETYRKKGDVADVDRMQHREIEHERELGQSTRADDARHTAYLKNLLDNDRRLEAEYRKKGDAKNADRMHKLALEHEKELGMRK
ncbi:MAG: hypothetical protein ACTHL1_11320 [Burkholderiaceae bacterium]